jgi:hypothetical protein
MPVETAEPVPDERVAVVTAVEVESVVEASVAEPEVFAAQTPAEPPASVSPGGSIDGLFGGAGVSFGDQNAAATLAGAFGAVEEGMQAENGAHPTPAAPMAGAPARRATEELSLDSVFREPSGSHAADRPGFSFDRFFSGGPPAQGSTGSETPVQGVQPASPDDDIEQFNSWLDGLKKK